MDQSGDYDAAGKPDEVGAAGRLGVHELQPGGRGDRDAGEHGRGKHVELHYDHQLWRAGSAERERTEQHTELE